MGRAPCCDKSGLKKGPWTAEEDQKLTGYIQKHGHGSWRLLPKNAGLARCGKSCRLRWTNYLRPGIKRGRFSFEEEETIIQLHKMLGNKWSAIASHLPGRTDNEIKNYWNTHIRKRLTRMGINPVTHTSNLDLFPLCNPNLLNLCGLLDLQPLVKAQLMKLAVSVFASHCQPLGFVNQLNLYHQQQQQQQQQQQFPVDAIPPLQNLQLALEAQQLQNQFQQQLPPNGNTAEDKFVDEGQLHITNFNLCNNSMPDSDLMIEQGGSSNTSLDATLCNLIAQSFSFDGANYNQNSWCCNTTSDFSTPSSSSNNLSSPSAYINIKSIEDERDSSCSNLFGLQIPDLLDISDYL